MIRGAFLILMMTAIGGGAFYAGILQQPTQPGPDPVTHRPSVPRIEQVQALASLVTLNVPISDLHVSELAGYTGGVKIMVNVRGDVQIMTDLSNARFEDIDEQRLDAVLVLPRPEAQRPRVDHEKTRIVEIQRTGMWRIGPGQSAERAVTNRAMSAAQRVLGEAAKDEKLITQACAQTEKVMDQFFGALGWNVIVRWDAPPTGLDATATAAAVK
ncbi:MAG: DUF4230 domain-containing protein [Phycisphaeraceae bacterium]